MKIRTNYVSNSSSSSFLLSKEFLKIAKELLESDEVVYEEPTQEDFQKLEMKNRYLKVDKETTDKIKMKEKYLNKKEF